MYPTISDLLADLFGIQLALPIQTFGFFVGLAFILAAWVWNLEILRYEKNGLLPARKVKIISGLPASRAELFSSGLVGFLLGYKLLYAAGHYSEFAENPQSVILSGKGSFIGGLLVAGLMAYLKYREKEKQKKDKAEETEQTIYVHDETGNFVIVCIVGGLLGAKIFHNLENIKEFMEDPLGSILSFSGLTMYGGLIVVSVSLYYYCKKIGIKFLHLADTASAPLFLGYGIGRIGCHMSGDGDWGIVNNLNKPGWMNFMPDWFWKYQYPHNVISEGIPIPGCEGRHCMMLPEPVFPTPLYEAIASLLLFAFLWSIRKKIKVPGLLFSIYLFFNGLERVLIEQIRVNTLYDFGSFGLTQAEIISSCLLLSGLAGIFYFYRKNSIIKNES